MTPEREFYHKTALKKFIEIVKDSDLVYDIGKHGQFSYSEFLPGLHVRTIDRDASTHPGLFMDVEKLKEPCPRLAPAVLCNGVLEQCDNPFALVQGIKNLVMVGGHVLFGVMSVGYPIIEIDYVRFTPNGFRRLLEREGFDLVEFDEVKRGGVPSYIYAIAKRRS